MMFKTHEPFLMILTMFMMITHKFYCESKAINKYIYTLDVSDPLKYKWSSSLANYDGSSTTKPSTPTYYKTVESNTSRPWVNRALIFFAICAGIGLIYIK